MANAQTTSRILIVDDSEDTREVLSRNLLAAGYVVHAASGVSQALAVLAVTPVDLVITDLRMPGASGLDLIRHVRENLEDTAIMMITGYASVGGAVEAVQAGAENYLPKPFTDEELLAAVGQAIENLERRRAGRAAPGAAPRPEQRFGLLGQSEAMDRVLAAIEKAAAASATVLIQGESGTGKELVARAIHYGGLRAAAPFVPVNCGGIPDGLLESELFGHVKGAFTGAVESRAGFFQTADGGTIFLDEISEMTLAMQVKLLRALQSREVTMLGSSRPRQVDVRIVAATNRDLMAMVRQGRFREDLYYRLNVICIELPPLREREGDVLLLARRFADRFASEAGRPPLEFTDRALAALAGYDWPGNVRELENVIQRLVVMTERGPVDVPDLPALMRFSARGAGPLRSLAEVEAEHVRAVLASVDGNKTRAAEILAIDRKTLREKLRRIGEPD